MEYITQRLKCHKEYTSAPELENILFHRNYSSPPIQSTLSLPGKELAPLTVFLVFYRPQKIASYLCIVLRVATAQEHLPCVNYLQLINSSKTLWDKYYSFHPHFTNQETEAQRY